MPGWSTRCGRSASATVLSGPGLIMGGRSISEVKAPFASIGPVGYPRTSTMQDLNDLHYFVSVVDHGGFAAAGRTLGLQKSKLSRRILQLEERPGVGPLNRSAPRIPGAAVWAA